MALGTHRTAGAKGLRLTYLVRVGVHDDQVAAQLAVHRGCARQRRAEEAELHPHEKIGEDDPDDRGDELGASVLELKPGDGKSFRNGLLIGCALPCR